MEEKSGTQQKPDSEKTTSSVHGYVQFGDIRLELNGAGATPKQGFEPTRTELIQLAKYWAEEELTIHMIAFEDGVMDRSDCRSIIYARSRMSLFDSILCEGEVEKVRHEERERRRRLVGDKFWSRFVSRDQKDIRRIIEERYGEEVPGYAYEELKKMGAARLPELPAKTVADAMRYAARDIEKGDAPSNDCNHEWVRDYDASTESNVDLERCRLCCALRSVEENENDPMAEPPTRDADDLFEQITEVEDDLAKQ